MATSKDFDLTILSLGYQEYVVPKSAAMAFFNACASGEIYRLENHYSDGRTEYHIKALDNNLMPTIRIINPVVFHQGLESKRVYDEAKARKRKEKESIK